MMNSADFVKRLGIKYPILCGAMYPCSNPELVAAASEAGGLGIVQPLSLSFAHGYPLKEGLQKIKSLTSQPIGMNLLIEQSSQVYLERMKKYFDIALEEGVRIFVTALGKPDYFVKKAHEVGGFVIHDVTDRKWALRAKDAGVDALIAVNSLAGGHAGPKDPQTLYDELKDLGLPLICAGGVGNKKAYNEALQRGYVAVQMGTRFLASQECNISEDYKREILKAHAKDIVHTLKLTGVPVAVIETEFVKKVGTQAGPIARYMLSHSKFKHWMRLYYSLQSFWSLKKTFQNENSRQGYYQAGKSVEGIDSILSVQEIVQSFVKS